MRVSSVLFALLSGAAMVSAADEPTNPIATPSPTSTVQLTSTLTMTVVRVMTATLSSNTSALALATKVASQPNATVAFGTSKSPALATTNAAPRGIVDLTVAGLAGAALFMAL